MDPVLEVLLREDRLGCVWELLDCMDFGRELVDLVNMSIFFLVCSCCFVFFVSTGVQLLPMDLLCDAATGEVGEVGEVGDGIFARGEFGLECFLSRYEEGTQPSFPAMSTYHHPVAFFVMTEHVVPALKERPSPAFPAAKSAIAT